MIYFRNKYRFNKESLEYDKIPIRPRRIIIYTIITLLLTVISLYSLSTFYDTPKEKKLKSHVDMLVSDVYILNKRIDGLEDILSEVEIMDSIVYRSIFETDPYFKEYSRKYNTIDSAYNMKYVDLVDATHRKINRLEQKLTNEYYDLEHLQEISLERQDYLKSVPSIQPISNKTLRRTASGWGYRIHPIYKIKKFHYGLDFSAKTGTPIYATGKSKVYYAAYNNGGYGKVVILDHGYGYKTLYGHMESIYVKNGDIINRGEIIGEVGNTGSSTGPHLHYEVIYYGQKVNPIHYFFNDLNPEEYDKMIKISSQMDRTYD